MNKTKKMVFVSMLVSIALIIYIVELQIPVLVPGIPGIKLGLANSISLVALILFGWKEALVIMLLRIILGSIFGGNMAALMFSLAGGLLSNIVMIILYKYLKNNLSIITISICGAVFHNIGQLLVAALIIQNFRIYIYLPVLLVSGVITGYFIGVLTNFLATRLKKLRIFQK